MGRQILFHMLSDDCEAFVELVQQRDNVVITPFVDDLAEVQDFSDGKNAYGQWLCLWNQALLPTLSRNLVRDVSPTHRIEDSLPVLQLNTRGPIEWAGKPALTQGRLYAYSYQKFPAVRIWYEALARWIRKRFLKNPVPWMGGYVGPQAYTWHKAGGLLLPYVPPPVNPEWVNRVLAQQRQK